MTTQANWPDFLAVDFYCGAGGYVIAGVDAEQVPPENVC